MSGSRGRWLVDSPQTSCQLLLKLELYGELSLLFRSFVLARIPALLFLLSLHTLM